MFFAHKINKSEPSPQQQSKNRSNATTSTMTFPNAFCSLKESNPYQHQHAAHSDKNATSETSGETRQSVSTSANEMTSNKATKRRNPLKWITQHGLTPREPVHAADQETTKKTTNKKNKKKLRPTKSKNSESHRFPAEPNTFFRQRRKLLKFQKLEW
jgi:hypothetical protein